MRVLKSFSPWFPLLCASRRLILLCVCTKWLDSRVGIAKADEARRGSWGERGRKEAHQRQLRGPALGVLQWGRGVPVEPRTPYLYWAWIQEMSQMDTVNWAWRGRADPEPRCLTQMPAHRGAKGCSPSCKHPHGTAQGHSPAEISPSSFQLLQISYPSVEKPLLAFHYCGGASREGFRWTPPSLPGTAWPKEKQEESKDHQIILLGASCPMVTNSRPWKDITVPGLAKTRVNQTLKNEGIFT